MANLFQPSIVRATDSNGSPISGAKLFFFYTETLTAAPWYLDADGLVAGTNPQVADATGLFAPIYMDQDVIYRIRQTDSTGSVIIWDVDPVRGFDESQLSASSDAAVAAGAAAVIARAGAETAETGAVAAQTEAETARDTAVAAAEQAAVSASTLIYADTTAGLAATASGGYFYVQNVDDNLQLYQDNAGVADIQPFVVTGYANLIAERELIEAAAATVNETLEEVGLASQSLLVVNEVPDDGIVAELVDLEYRMLLGRVYETGELVGYDVDQLASVGSGAAADPVQLADADVPATADWVGIPLTGESLAAGAYSTPVLSSAQPYANLTFGSGPKSSKPANMHGGLNTSPGTTTAIALIEDENDTTVANVEGETICSGMANGLVERGARYGNPPATSIFFASCAGQSGARLDQINQSSDWYQQLLDHVTEAKALATTAGKTYKVGWVPLIIGVNDHNAGTTYELFLERLLQYAEDVDTDLRAITGQSEPICTLISQNQNGGVVAQAQFDACNESSLIKFVANTWLFPKHTDNNHLSNIGTRWLADFFARAASDMRDKRKEPDCLWPIAAWAIGTTAYLKFRVPLKPLVIDTTDLLEATDYGQLISDGTGTLTLSAGTVVNEDTLQFTLNRALGSDPVWRCGRDYLGAGYTDSSSGWFSHNLRDSTSETITISAVERPLYHLAPAFEIPISVVEA